MKIFNCLIRLKRFDSGIISIYVLKELWILGTL